MLLDNLKLLLRLYIRPRATMAMIVDEGSFLFGVIAIAVLTFVVTTTGAFVGTLHQLAAVQAMESNEGAEAAEVVAPEPSEETVPLIVVAALWSKLGTFSVVAGLVLLYIPVLIFVMT